MRYLIIVSILILAACGGGDDTATNQTSETSTVGPATATSRPAIAATSTMAGPPLIPTATTAAVATVPPTETSVPATAAPTNTIAPIATATVAQSADVSVANWASRVNSINSYQVFGVVQNTGTAAAQEVQVAVSLFDAAGTIIGSGESIYILPVIEAGGRSPFYVSISDIDEASVAKTELQVQFKKYDSTDFMIKYYNVSDISIEQIVWNADKIVGQVKNNGTKPVYGVSVLVVGYNGDGTVFGVENVYIDLDEVGPGMTSSFDREMYQYDGAAPASVEAWAYGRNPT